MRYPFLFLKILDTRGDKRLKSCLYDFVYLWTGTRVEFRRKCCALLYYFLHFFLLA